MRYNVQLENDDHFRLSIGGSLRLLKSSVELSILYASTSNDASVNHIPHDCRSITADLERLSNVAGSGID